MKHLVVAFATVSCICALSHPDYIKPCHIKKPDFNKCALEHGNYAIPYLVKGDKQRGVPKMNPMKLPLVEVVESNFRLAMKDLSVYGLENSSLTDIKMNQTYLDLTFHADRLMFIGQYEVDGKILFLSLQGSGPCNLTSVGGNFRFVSVLQEYTEGKETFVKFNKPTMDYTLERAYFYLENLLDSGDQQIGIDINRILNENWEDVLKDIDVPLKETVTTVVESVVSKILRNIPAKNIFPD
ncbi:uncharacterized protein LOC663750 isoform X2 [Tribolium castaneum]|uniref:Protein takeout-like Protein n=1 Tax=Tribolium castaneum TaxID=7070 RepID=D6WAM9_TRICA|nr:PREDICTED: uncharacterized protein LOC663750 [Tribolium castaneum]EEZ98653.1 Protein takeout-like Protein [Tribolium castaneum]|eukprot:XP_008201660.2 PREDICTED: uncharacterized protein LOC663750 [Tribolium castaneum]